uniref:Uncharacterized protein n=1 Tax=Setaria viridis TaxID=4556 RepID=A0A4U6V5S0_SETVI|nr:hypothetical protein SEVIR_4G253000v2 [Setaria viridis]
MDQMASACGEANKLLAMVCQVGGKNPKEKRHANAATPEHDKSNPSVPKASTPKVVYGRPHIKQDPVHVQHISIPFCPLACPWQNGRPAWGRATRPSLERLGPNHLKFTSWMAGHRQKCRMDGRDTEREAYSGQILGRIGSNFSGQFLNHRIIVFFSTSHENQDTFCSTG